MWIGIKLDWISLYGFSECCYERFIVKSQGIRLQFIRLRKNGEFCIKTKEKIRIKLFPSSPKDTSVARVWIAKLNGEKDDLPSKVYVCSDHFEHDCFDSSWMPMSTLTYSDRPIQRCLCPGAILTKFPHKPVKERHFSKQREETHRKKEVCFSYSSESIN